MISLRRAYLLISFLAALLLAFSSGLAPAAQLQAAELELIFQTRDAASGAVQKTAVRVNPHRVGVIAVDVWKRGLQGVHRRQGGGREPGDARSVAGMAI